MSKYPWFLTSLHSAMTLVMKSQTSSFFQPKNRVKSASMMDSRPNTKLASVHSPIVLCLASRGHWLMGHLKGMRTMSTNPAFRIISTDRPHVSRRNPDRSPASIINSVHLPKSDCGVMEPSSHLIGKLMSCISSQPPELRFLSPRSLSVSRFRQREGGWVLDWQRNETTHSKA